ncbi:MAG: cell division protein FtsA [Candidatus Eisenbacteria bacterium]|nr:cell division protein FtsA [Candidatus Eisenbacteria bacterium]
MRKSEILVGLDLGTSRVKVVVADLSERGAPEILGAGESVARGIEAGVVVNMDMASASIREAVEAAEDSADVEIGRVSISIDGEHIKGIDSRGVIAVSRSGGEITKGEVDTVLEAAKTLALPVGRAIVDVLPQEFFVDGQRGIRTPIGMSGVRLGSKVHIVTASQQAVDNVIRAVRKVGLRTDGITLRPLAASLASVSPDEKELGTLVVNLGAGTTGLVLYQAGAVRHTASIGWGASSITNDIAVGLRVPLSRAEQLKMEHGCALVSAAGDDPIEIPTVGGGPPRESSKQILAAVIEPRVGEIFELVANELKSTEYSNVVPAGVVLTGGGARLEHVAELAEQFFGTPARVGLPDRVSGSFDAVADPAYAAAVGTVVATAETSGGGRYRGEMPLAGTVQRVRQLVDRFL